MFSNKAENATLFCVKIKWGRIMSEMSRWQIICIQCVSLSSGKLVLPNQLLYHFKHCRKREAHIYFLDKLSWDNRNLVDCLFRRKFLVEDKCMHIYFPVWVYIVIMFNVLHSCSPFSCFNWKLVWFYRKNEQTKNNSLETDCVLLSFEEQKTAQLSVLKMTFSWSYNHWSSL